MKLTSLSHLSDEALVARIHVLVGVGRRVVAKLVAFLAEVEHRRLHLKAAYSSLQDFCMRALGMSEGEAFRRMTAARLTLRFPSIPDRIARGDLHLSGLVLLRPHLTSENHEELLDAAARLTKDGIQRLLAQRAPRPDVPSSIATIPEQETLGVPAAGSHSSAMRAPVVPQKTIEPLSPARHRVELTVSTELREKIERAVELMRHANPTGDLAVLVDRAVDLLLEKLEKRKFGRTNRPRAKKNGEGEGKGEPETRRVPNDARRDAHSRDGGQCSYVDEHGNRCPSRGFLELDHVRAWARGGKSTGPNTRILCKSHNRYVAELEFGREHVESCIDIRQRKSHRAPPLSNEARSEMPDEKKLFESARRTLRGMGFRPEETMRALDIVRTRHVGSPPLPIAKLLRDTLAILGEHLTTRSTAT